MLRDRDLAPSTNPFLLQAKCRDEGISRQNSGKSDFLCFFFVFFLLYSCVTMYHTYGNRISKIFHSLLIADPPPAHQDMCGVLSHNENGWGWAGRLLLVALPCSVPWENWRSYYPSELPLELPSPPTWTRLSQQKESNPFEALCILEVDTSHIIFQLYNILLTYTFSSSPPGTRIGSWDTFLPRLTGIGPHLCILLVQLRS